MLDFVIQGKSALSALNVLGVLLFSGIALVVVGFIGLFVLPRRPSSLWRGLFGSALLSGILLLALPPAVFIYRTLNRKTEIFAFQFPLDQAAPLTSFDQTQTHCGTVPYGNGRTMTSCIFEGDIALRLVSGSSPISFEHVHALWVNGEHESVDSLGFLSEPYSLEQAVRLSRELIVRWNGSPQQLEDWQRTNPTSDLTNPVLPPPDGSNFPRMQVILKKIENPAYAQAPWFLRVNLGRGDAPIAQDGTPPSASAQS
ncbi:MAG: hypothetical protein U0136_11180 [Bdellovibrionota bacterium]